MRQTLSPTAWAWILVGFLITAGTSLGHQAGTGAKKPLLDVHGDPLPAGATARFGSIRWRMSSDIVEVALSRDGNRVAASDWFRHLVVWEVETGREVLSFRWAGHNPRGLVFSPDGQYLATCSAVPFDTEVKKVVFRLWDLATGKERSKWECPGTSVPKLMFADDGKTLISNGFEQPVTVWEVPSGKKLRQFPDDGKVPYYCAVTPNGRLAVVAPDDLHMHVYSLASGQLQYKLTSPDQLRNFAFSPDSRSLLTWASGYLRVWEMASGKERLHLTWKKSHDWMCFSPDATKLAVFGSGPDIHWLDAFTGQLLGSWSGHQDVVGTLAFSGDGRRAASGAKDGTVRVWDTATGKTIRGPSGPARECWSLHYAADGKTILAGSADLHFLDAATLQEQHRLHVAGVHWRSLVQSHDRQLAAALDDSGEICLVDVKARKVLRTLTKARSARNLAFGPDAKRLYVLSDFTTLQVLDVQTGEELPALSTNLNQAYGLAVSPMGKLVVSEGGTVYLSHLRIWDLATGQEEARPAFIAHSPVASPAGSWLAIQGPRLELLLWDMVGRRRPRLVRDASANYALCFSDDGKWLAAGYGYGLVKVWEVASRQKVAELHGQRGTVMALAFAPDGTALVSASADGTALKWETAGWRP
jgi:WD40 repeat protein